MLLDDYNQKLDRYTRGIVRRKVNQLIGRAGFTNQDREDLEHDLLARVLQSLPSFDPQRGHRNKFITAVVERHVANILRNKMAVKRDHRRLSSLNVMIKVDDDFTELAQTIRQREMDARRGRYPRSEEELAQLAFDLAEVIAGMPPEMRELVERLKHESLSEIARDQGVPRTTLAETIRHVRRRFEAAGLKSYL